MVKKKKKKKKLIWENIKWSFWGIFEVVPSLKGKPFRFIILKLCMYILLALKQNQITCTAN